jgi:hypothetical protein
VTVAKLHYERRHNCMRVTSTALVVVVGLVVVASQPARGVQAQQLPDSAAHAQRPLDIYPDARLDSDETTALAGSDPRVNVYRTPSDFDIVLNYYRFKRRQSVNVVEEDPAARFARIADLLEKPEPAPALLADRFVRRFHAFVFGPRTPERAEAAAAWRTHARQFDGRRQRIAEGTRVTIFHPYISNLTFRLLDDTVIVLRSSGG